MVLDGRCCIFELRFFGVLNPTMVESVMVFVVIIVNWNNSVC